MRYGIMCVLAAVTVAVAARPVPAADQGSTSTNIHWAIDTGEYDGEAGVPIHEVQYRRGARRSGYYRTPPARRFYYRAPAYRYPYRGYSRWRSPYSGYRRWGYRYPYGYGPGIYFRGPRVGVGIGW